MTADVELLPEPYGYLRELDGRLQMSIGPVHPADRAGGYATPWAAMYDPERVRANVAHATAPLQAEIEALRAEVGELHMRAKRRDQYAVEKAAQALDWKDRAERLAEALLEAADMLLADYPETAKRLRAALHPTSAQENDDA